MPKTEPDLDSAYALKTPEDSVRLYRDWAQTYDTDFASAMDYVYPAAVAQVFSECAVPLDDPVLDVGAGTGLVGAALAGLGAWAVDGLDISAEMLAEAFGKGCYRAVHQADLTQSLNIPSSIYGALVSAGTFTHGHVGPDALDELLRIAKPGAIFVLGINAAVYQDQGFGRKFDMLAAMIKDFRLVERRIYGDKAAADHASDTALIAVFHKR